jgi:hypothetical protein
LPNSIPPLLLLHYTLWEEKGLRKSCFVARIVQNVTVIGVIVAIWLLIPPSYTPYSVPLTKSFTFFEAWQELRQRCRA